MNPRVRDARSYTVKVSDRHLLPHWVQGNFLYLCGQSVKNQERSRVPRETLIPELKMELF